MLSTPRIRNWLGSRSATWFFPALAFALTLPALGFGLQTDDHVRARTSRSPALHAASALCVGLALLSAEAGVFVLAYLGAYAWVYESGSLWKRTRSVGPQLGVCCLWAIGYLASHAGIRGSSWYR